MSPRPTRRFPARLVAASLLLVVAGACGTRLSSLTPTTRPSSVVTTTTVPATTAPTSSSSSVAETTVPATTTATTTVPVTTVDPAAAKAEIKANWEKFFNAKSTLEERSALLQDSAKYAQALATLVQDPRMKSASAAVKGVELTGPDQATVTYDVLLNGAPALTNSSGIAAFQGGGWKVSGESFCALATLGSTTPVPGCS
jgi:hypothetical protein